VVSSPPIPWSPDAELLVELDPQDGNASFRVEGLEGVTRATVHIVPAGTPSTAARSLRLRPLVDPPGPFDADGLLMFSPFRETQADRAALREFERRIGPRYYDFMLGARYRYAATCSIEANGIETPGTSAELYRVDAASVAEAIALDEASEAPPDILAIFEECRTFIVPGSHRVVWLVPDPA